MIKFYTGYEQRWEKALEEASLIETELKAPEYENAILLPLRKRKDSPPGATNDYHEGGVCTANYDFLAGMDRKYPRAEANFACIKSYVPDAVIYRNETVIFGGVILELFGHILVDCLPRMWYFIKNPDTPYKFVFLMMTNHKKLNKAFFDLAGLTEDRYEIITEPTQFQKVIVPDQAMFSLSRTGHPDWLLFFDRIKETVRKQYEKPEFDKVYLTRTQLPAEKHFEVNESFFENFYRQRGYTVVAPEKLSLAEQINIIMNASSIVTTMGTLSHMTVFADKNATCTFLMRTPSEVIRPQLIIDLLKGYKSFYVEAIKEILPSPQSRGVPLYFPTEYFAKCLQDQEMSYEEADLQAEMSCVIEEYIQKYTLNYSNPVSYRRIADLSAFDFINTMSYAFFDVKLDRKKYQKSKVVLENEKLKKEFQNPELAMENEDLKKENQKLKKELAKIKKSTSWKVTKPIRWLAKLFRKLRGK